MWIFHESWGSKGWRKKQGLGGEREGERNRGQLYVSAKVTEEKFYIKRLMLGENPLLVISTCTGLFMLICLSLCSVISGVFWAFLSQFLQGAA